VLNLFILTIMRETSDGKTTANDSATMRPMPTRPKRPRDSNQLAKLIVDIATGQVEDPDPDAGKDPQAIARGRKGGLKGGNARAATMTHEQRRESAKRAANARWGNETP
jgi:hypothetical protein